MSEQTTIDQPAAATAATSPEPNIGKLVIDTNVIVNGAPIRHLAKEFYTCPEVLAEVRSAHSREYLARLPFEIKVLNPSEDSVRAVIDFSRKTGDYASLSMPDIKVVALAHMLEVQENGREHIRKEPIKPRPAGQMPSAPPPRVVAKPAKAADQHDDDDDEEEEEEQQDDGWEVAASKKKLTNKQRKEIQEAERIELKKQKLKEKKKAKKARRKAAAAAAAAAATAPDGSDEQQQQDATKAEPETTGSSAKDTDSKSAQETPSTVAEPTKDDVQRISDSVKQLVLEDDGEEEESDSDDGEWITPDNVDDIRAAAMGVTPEELKEAKNMSVACMTADFAMQNTLLQMNLNLVSPGGHRVTRVKNWVLRCHACFTVTSDMDKKFCPKCGNASLSRVSCSTTSDGNVVYYLKRNYKYNLRGTKYDIPEPKGGRFVNNIVLREDQKEYIKAKQHQRRQKALDMFDPDFIPLAGKVGDHLRIGNNMYGTDIIGYGRRNPNVVRKKGTRKK